MTTDQRQYLQVAFPEDDTIKCYLDDQGDPLMTLGPIADINFFIGANNSGKSRMLRWLCRRGEHQLLSEKIGKTLSADLQEVRSLDGFLASQRATAFSWQHRNPAQTPNIARFVRPDGNVVYANIASGHNRRALEDLLSQQAQVEGSRNTLRLEARTFENGVAGVHVRAEEPVITASLDVVPSDVAQRAIGIAAILDRWADIEIAQDGNKWEGDDLRRIEPGGRIYVPILRSPHSMRDRVDRVRDLTASVAEAFKEKVAERYGVDRNVIWTGQELFRRVLEDRNDAEEVRMRFSAFTAFIRDSFFPGRSLDVVAKIRQGDDGVNDKSWGEIIVRVGDGPERPLYDLGDGVQALLLLLYPTFMAEPGTWLFVEEPETHLHPGFQRLFLETLLNNDAIKNKNLKFFFTTHSNHFIDYSIEHNGQMSVFAFAEAPKVGNDQRFTVRNVVGPDRDVLRDLGVRNGSVLLANCAIWVEGPTDRLYVRAFLKAYADEHLEQRKFREDLHYAFFEYGGSLLAHYEFDDQKKTDTIAAQFIANHVFLLADRDGESEKTTAKHDKFRAMERAPDFVYSVTPGREVENLLSVTQLRLVTKADLNGTADVDYRANGIGRFLKDKGEPRKFTESATGTLTDYWKKELAEEIGPAVTWANMSDDARKLTEDIYKFISDHNVDVK